MSKYFTPIIPKPNTVFLFFSSFVLFISMRFITAVFKILFMHIVKQKITKKNFFFFTYLFYFMCEWNQFQWFYTSNTISFIVFLPESKTKDKSMNRKYSDIALGVNIKNTYVYIDKNVFIHWIQIENGKIFCFHWWTKKRELWNLVFVSIFCCVFDIQRGNDDCIDKVKQIKEYTKYKLTK